MSMTGKSVSSPISTGGSGEQFEQHVAGLALGLLLVRGTPPILTDTSVVEVHFQTEHRCWRTDDLLIIGEKVDGKQRQLALQVKRSFRVSARDNDCRKTVTGMWHDFLSDRFDETQDQMAVVTLHGTSTLLRDFVSLLECARASKDADDFNHRLSRDRLLSKKAKNQNSDLRLILKEETGEVPADNTYWNFLRAINVLSYDFNTSSSQTEALVLSLLAACVVDGSETKAAAKATWAALLECAGSGKPVAKSYARDDLPAELLNRLEPVSAGDRSDLKALVEHGKTVRDGIRSMIGDCYVLPRDGEVQSLAEKVAEHRVVFLSGAAGSGKSALARELLSRVEDRYLVLSFQAVEFATAHVDEALAAAQTSLNLQRLIALLAGHDRIVVLVDGVERLLECSVRDGFSQLLQLVSKTRSTQFVLTVRDYSLETVRSALIPNDVRPTVHKVPALTDRELNRLGDNVPELALPLGNAALRTFLRTPYLLDLASRLDWEDTTFPANLRDFRRKVWREIVRVDDRAAGGMPGRRERAFLDIAWRRALELRSFVPPMVKDPEAFDALCQDYLLATPRDSSAVYAFTHDVLEDWGVLQSIEDRFAEGGESPRALEKAVGRYPALRRGLRQWLAERFQKDADDAQALVLKVIAEEGFEAHFRDDCLVAALLSESVADFVDACRPRIVHGDFALLDQITHVLRVACRKSPDWLDEPGLPSHMLVPMGSGWAPLLRLMLDLIDALLPERSQMVLALVEDWARQIHWQNTSPEGVVEAGAIVSRLVEEFDGYDPKGARERALRVVVKIPGAVPKFKNLMERAKTCRHDDLTAFGLMELILAKTEGGHVCREYPDEVIALVDSRLRLLDMDQEQERTMHGSLLDEIDYRFGVRRLPIVTYFPGSAIQGPFAVLLRYHRSKAVAFILNLLNHVGQSYAMSRWEGRAMEPASSVSLQVPSYGGVDQWADQQLYNLYRGNQVGPDSVVSALMALEAWLLRLGKNDGDDLEAWLLHIIENSNNVMATSVVASVCVAYPEMAGQAGLTLLSCRKVVELDRGRLESESGTAISALSGLNPRHRLFALEREESDKFAHRREDLESLAVRMQLGEHRDDVWAIIDQHRAVVEGDDSGEDTRSWRLALHRMDVRRYEPQEAPEGVGTANSQGTGSRLHLASGELDPDIQHMVDTAAASSGFVRRCQALNNLAWKLWGQHVSVEDVDWRTALLAEAQAIERELSEPEELYRDGLGFAAAVCLRDHLDELDEAEFDWCVRRVDFEVRRKSDTRDRVARAGRSVSADRLCASVVPLLVLHSKEVEGVHGMDLLSVSLTHAIEEVSEYAFGGLGAFMDEDNKQLTLQCVAAACYRSRLANEAREVAQQRLAAGSHKGPDPFESIVPAVREAVSGGSLDVERELISLDFRNPAADFAIKATLAVFGRRPAWQESRRFYSRVARWLFDSSGEGFGGDGQLNSRRYEIESEALRSLARFALRLPFSDAVSICAPVIEAVSIPSQAREVSYFVSDLIMCADLSSNDCFWELWQRLADEATGSPWGKALEDERSFGLELLQMIFLGPLWNEEAKHWHRLEGHVHRVDKLALSFPATAPVIRDYTDYLRTIGYGSLPGAFKVVGQMLEKGNAVRIASDSDVAFNLETLLRHFVYGRPHRIKADAPLREAILDTLDALVAGGSASGYLMRDDFVTPSPHCDEAT